MRAFRSFFFCHNYKGIKNKLKSRWGFHNKNVKLQSIAHERIYILHLIKVFFILSSTFQKQKVYPQAIYFLTSKALPSNILIIINK